MVHLRDQLKKARQELKRMHRARHERACEHELCETTQRYSYYLANANKKIDVRQLVPFGELAGRIRSERRTYLDVDRLYTLWQGVRELPQSARAVAEVGVYRGGSARFIAEALCLHNRCDVVFYACDTFEGHTEVEQDLDGLHRPGVQFRRTTARKVAKYLTGLDGVRIVQGDIRQTASAFESEHGFGLVHIDVDVYPITQFCLQFFASRVIPGGTIVVDDYGTTTCRGVQKAVDEFAARHGQFRLYHLLTGQALLLRFS
jgi:O-methyltransferase